jgi:hypothetical protein
MTGPVFELPVTGGFVRQSAFEAMAQAVVDRTLRAPATEPVMQPLPAAADRANKPLAFNSSGQPVALSGVIDPGDVVVSTYGESLVAAADAATARDLLGANRFTHGATLTVVRSLQSLASEGLSIRDFDSSASLGNGVYDATTAMQRLAAEAAGNGWMARLPPGDFVIEDTVLFDEAEATTLGAPRGGLRGAGIAQTRITCAAGDYTALEFVGGPETGVGYGVTSGGFYLRKSDSLGTGIGLNNYAFCEFDQMLVTGFETGLTGADALSTLFRSVFLRNNKFGLSLFFEDFSRPNALTFINCDLGLNTEYGAFISGPSTLTWVGGAIQGNGIGGVGSTRGGIFIVNGGVEGAVGATFQGAYFEYNSGAADLSIDHTANFATYNCTGCTFNRINSTDFVTSNLVVTAADSDVRVGLASCGFESFGSYTESGARPYIAVSGAGAKLEDLGGNLFRSTTAYVDLAKFGPAMRSGRLGSDGTGVNLPRGWSSAKAGTGVYTVTHNLGTTDYAVIATCNSSNADLVQRVTVAADSFSIVTVAAAGTAVDAPVSFLLTRTAN